MTLGYASAVADPFARRASFDARRADQARSACVDELPIVLHPLIRRLFVCVVVIATLPLDGGSAAEDTSVPVPTARTAVTHHRVTVDGRTLRYAATAGLTVLRDKTNQAKLAMFSVSYRLEGPASNARPIAFIWNGGPGSSSVWLHMGAFAPVRVLTSNTSPVAPPGVLSENEDTLLPATDLVFVDAPGTGFGRLVGKSTKDDYYGVDQDARAFTDFIVRWLTENGRWGSPKYLIGESYGTARAANVVNRLQEAGVGVNGVVLISSALDLTALDPAQPGDDRSCIAFLPSEAAVAWYHEALPNGRTGTLESFLTQVRTFAGGAYATALLRGDTLPAADRARLAQQLHAYLGLDTTYIERANLRIEPAHFEKELLRGRGSVTGRLDGRFLGADLDANNDSPSYDPTLDATIGAAFTGQFNRYVRDDLRFTDDDTYLATNYPEIGIAWKFSRDTTDPEVASFSPNVLPDLARALTKNPTLRIFSANGWFDLATPFYGTELALRHLGIAPELQPHITFGYYPSGHMVYLDGASRHQLRMDITSFIKR